MAGLRYPDQFRPRPGSHAWLKTPSIKLSLNFYILNRKTAYSSRAWLCLKPGVDFHRPQNHIEDCPTVP